MTNFFSSYDGDHQIRMVASAPQEISLFPSEEKQTSLTRFECPSSKLIWDRSPKFQIRIVLSSLQEANKFPSAENASDVTDPECPYKILSI